MTQKEIIQYNKRCAKFLGFKYHEESEYWTTMLWGGGGFTLNQMKFHSDWNWIMEVVEAIEKLDNRKFKIRIFYNICEIEKNYKPLIHFYYNRKRIKKQAVVQAINQFLIWYNNEKSN